MAFASGTKRKPDGWIWAQNTSKAHGGDFRRKTISPEKNTSLSLRNAVYLSVSRAFIVFLHLFAYFYFFMGG